jgi:hypothetical protein
MQTGFMGDCLHRNIGYGTLTIQCSLKCVGTLMFLLCSVGTVGTFGVSSPEALERNIGLCVFQHNSFMEMLLDNTTHYHGNAVTRQWQGIGI